MVEEGSNVPGPQPRRAGASGVKQEERGEPLVGLEPTTARLRIECSTTELQWPINSAGAHAGAPEGHALARIRTATPFGTTPSRWRVYQFHHQGKNYGADGARTRDLSSDSRVL